MGRIILDSAASIDKWRSVLFLWGGVFLGLLFVSTPLGDVVMSTWHLLPWWVVPVFLLASLAILFVRGLVKANFEAFQEVELRLKEERRTRKVLEGKLTTEKRRTGVKRALAHAALVGERLHNTKPTIEQYESWSNLVAVMIWFAFEDFGRVRLFYNDFEVSVDVLAEDSDAKQAIRRRLKYIHELIPQVDTLNVAPAFNAAEWVGHRPPHMKMPTQAQEVFNRVKEIQESANQQ